VNQIFQRVDFPRLRKMSTLDRNGGQRLAEQSNFAFTFRHVYRFILQAMKGDTAAANVMFERYLAGELSEELLAISRRCVSADRARAVKTEPEEESANRETERL
jgi:hypothetical protein